MKEKPDIACPRCDTAQAPEKIGPGRYLCPCCSKIFFVPKGLRQSA